MLNMRIDIRNFSLLILIVALSAMAWVNPEYLDSRFFAAVAEFRSGNYSKAHLGFSDLLIDSRGSRYYPMTYYMLALSSYKAGDYDIASREFADFAGKFPDNPASGRAWTYMGNSLYLTGQALEAAKAYINALDSPSTDEQTRQISRKSVEYLLWGYLSKDQLLIVNDYAEGSSSQLVDYIRAKRHELSGETSRALEISNRSLNRRPDGEYADSLKKLSERISKQISDNLTVAVFAPTTGQYGDLGRSMVNGIKLAFAQYESQSRKKIDLVIEDTGADVLVGSYSARNVFNRRNPVAAIGPLTSDVAVGIGVFCDQYRIPMITPTASKDGLAGLSPYVFQIATPPSVGAGKLVEWAHTNLGITEFSALAPDDPIGRKATANFARKIEEVGGELVSVAYYQDGTVDFSQQLKAIKEPYYKKMQRLVARADTSDIRFYKPDGSMRKEDEWIVHIPALFVPAYFEDLVNILPQVPFNYIRTRLLGSNGWIIEDVRTMDAAYIDSSIVVADNFWSDKDNPRWESFSREYRRTYGYEPDQIAAYGYDAANLICKGFASGAITPDQIRDYLSGVSDYAGPSGMVDFDAAGANLKSTLVIFDRKTPKRID